MNGTCAATALMERSGICLPTDGPASVGDGSSSRMVSGTSSEVSKRSPDAHIQLIYERHVTQWTPY